MMLLSSDTIDWLCIVIVLRISTDSHLSITYVVTLGVSTLLCPYPTCTQSAKAILILLWCHISILKIEHTCIQWFPMSYFGNWCIIGARKYPSSCNSPFLEVTITNYLGMLAIHCPVHWLATIRLIFVLDYTWSNHQLQFLTIVCCHGIKVCDERNKGK